MSDASDDVVEGGDDAESGGATPSEGSDRTAAGSPEGDASDDGESAELRELRERVERKYDFDDFGAADMAEMTAEEWEAAFEDASWVTGDALLERVEAELKSRIAAREVFAVLEYVEVDGRRALVAYSDTDYATVYPDGSVEGVGTVVRDVKPTVALCSMAEYEVAEPPTDWRLPAPEAVPETGSELGNWMLQLLGAVQVVVGIGALVAWPIMGARENLVMLVVGLGFVVIGVVLFAMVANARLSETFRLREYRDRLRSIGTASDERPEFLPFDDEAFEPVEGADRDRERPDGT